MDLTAEDAKLVTLARAAVGRTGAPTGAAVRDQDGRTYVAADVTLASFAIGALPLAVAMAVSSGATSLEAGAVLARGTDDAGELDLSVVRDVAGDGVPVYRADGTGTVIGVQTS